METNQEHKINKYFFLAIIVFFGIMLLYSLLEFFTAFLGAVMFYVLTKPLMTFLTKKWNWKKSVAASFILVITFLIILVPLLFVGNMLYAEAAKLSVNPDTILQPIKELNAGIDAKFNVNILSGETLNKIQNITTESVSYLLKGSLNFFSSITMLYFFFYFLLVNINRLEAAIVFYLPFKRTLVEWFGNELVAQTISNSIGIPLIGVIHGILAYIAYSISGLPEAGFWALITGFASIIPIVGTGLIWLPASIYLFVTHQTGYGVFLLLWGFLVIGLSDNLIRFMLAKKMSDVHPIVTVLGIIMGLNYFGITGLIFGPLIISYFIILLKIYYTEYQKPALERKRVKRVVANSYFNFSLTNKKKKE
ncbi:MAG: AI-2E family transporter [Chitinophagaceae bacterium]|jgi:predicted PurR-regulated permease PerM|nr:AI-2E family transporter [Chitinophagaceae bacterium]